MPPLPDGRRDPLQPRPRPIVVHVLVDEAHGLARLRSPQWWAVADLLKRLEIASRPARRGRGTVIPADRLADVVAYAELRGLVVRVASTGDSKPAGDVRRAA